MELVDVLVMKQTVMFVMKLVKELNYKSGLEMFW